MSYFIEFRLSGRSREYVENIIYDISSKFRVHGVTRKHVVPHISILGPFNIKQPFWPLSIFWRHSENELILAFQEELSKLPRVHFTLNGYHNFRRDVIFVDVSSNEGLRNLQHKLHERLHPLISGDSENMKGNFEPHVTLAFKDITPKFDSIWRYLQKKQKPHIRQTLLRVTLIKNGMIRCEYDMMQRRLLSRREALSKKEWQKTISILKSSTV